MKTLIVIPARLAATRLPNKPLAMLGDAPMIVQVWRRAVESGVGDVIVACDGEEIANAVRKVGGIAILTHPDLPSGSDRVWEAVQKLNQGQWKAPAMDTEGTPAPSPIAHYDIIINLQGDVPTLEPHLLRDILVPLANDDVAVATLVAPITRAEEHTNPAVVKVALALAPAAEHPLQTGRALYFSRAPIPANDGPRYHHIGVYAYRMAALEQFVALPPSPLEQREKLEQLRALEAGMRIDAVVVDTVPLGVDTPEDLARARSILEQ